MIKTYIEFCYPGLLCSETSIRVVAGREKPTEIPKTSFGYRFFDREEIEKDAETLKGESKNYSHWTYFGEIYTRDRVEIEKPNQKILITNMRDNNIDRVVFTKFGQAIPLFDGDIVEENF